MSQPAMNMQAQQDIERKLRILRHAEVVGNVAQTCRDFGISREIFYRWRKAYAAGGEQALVNPGRSPDTWKPRRQLPTHIEEEILDLRQSCQFGLERICRELKDYHGFRTSPTTVRSVLLRHNLPTQNKRMHSVLRQDP